MRYLINYLICIDIERIYESGSLSLRLKPGKIMQKNAGPEGSICKKLQTLGEAGFYRSISY
jgi:hypothetical protein